MNRLLALPLLLLTVAAPLAAQDDDGGDSPANTPAASGNDGHINILPLGQNNKKGLSGSGGDSGGAEGPTDPSIMYLKSFHVDAVYEHHKDFPSKVGSWGAFWITRPRQAYAAAFYSRSTGGKMDFHFCDITKAATSASGCGFIVWIADAPGGRPLCASSAEAEMAGPPNVYVVDKSLPAAKVNEALKATKVYKLGSNACALKPLKKYYCHLAALGWDGDKWSPDAQPGMMGEKCIGLRASSAYDTPEMATAAGARGTGL